MISAVARKAMDVILTSTLAAVFLGFSSGVGLDYDRLARELASGLVASPVETASIGRSALQPDDKERWKQQIAEAKASARKAATDYKSCLQAARDSVWKMWDPDGHCAEERIISMAASARYEAWK